MREYIITDAQSGQQYGPFNTTATDSLWLVFRYRMRKLGIKQAGNYITFNGSEYLFKTRKERELLYVLQELKGA